jgi:AICAR transformylase/IMP cyclohydrolase PurH
MNFSEYEESSKISFNTRQQFARKAFEHTADYDVAISTLFFNHLENIELPGSAHRFLCQNQRISGMVKIRISERRCTDISQILLTVFTEKN